MASQITNKIADAKETCNRISLLLHESTVSQDPQLLERAGTQIGTMANELRAPLNYWMTEYIEGKRGAGLPEFHYAKIRRRLDFPWSYKQRDFHKNKFVKILKTLNPDLITYIDSIQPYSTAGLWLGRLMEISNTDKHRIGNKVVWPGEIESFVIKFHDGKHRNIPRFLDGHLLHIYSEGSPRPPGISSTAVSFKLPCYYPPIGGWVNENQQWFFLWIEVADVRVDMGHFLYNTIEKVEKTLVELAAVIL